jgi:hypothetical protein
VAAACGRLGDPVRLAVMREIRLMLDPDEPRRAARLKIGALPAWWSARALHPCRIVLPKPTRFALNQN